jgi:alanine racemase
MYTLNEIAHIVGGRLHGDGSVVVKDLIYDSRKGFEKENAMFVALKTDSGNGHLYLNQLAEQGLRAALVMEEPGDETTYSYILVNDSLEALQDLSAYHRKRFDCKVIGITGSNGKTIVKDWLYALLC